MQQHQRFKPHQEDKRSENQKILTNQLARALTTVNLNRVRTQKMQNIHKKSDRTNYLYVCITGLPPLPNQFQGIGIPGQKIIIYPQGLQPDISAEQSKERLPLATMQKQAESLHQKLKNRTDKPLVFVFHSFGTSVFSTFLRIYYKDYMKRVIGIIAIGFYPIRGDHFQFFIDLTQSMTREELLSKVDELYQMHIQFHKANNLPIIKDKYANLAYLTAFGQGLGFSDLFEYNKGWYPLLKCFIYGRQDNRIDEAHLSQSALYYCYKRQFAKDYEQSIKKIFKNGYNIQTDNVQQRFVFNIQGGKHSIHVQRRFKPLVADIISQYLSMIEQLVD